MSTTEPAKQVCLRSDDGAADWRIGQVLKQEAAAMTAQKKLYILIPSTTRTSRCGAMVAHHLPKVGVVGSIPISGMMMVLK